MEMIGFDPKKGKRKEGDWMDHACLRWKWKSLRETRDNKKGMSIENDLVDGFLPHRSHGEYPQEGWNAAERRRSYRDCP